MTNTQKMWFTGTLFVVLFLGWFGLNGGFGWIEYKLERAKANNLFSFNQYNSLELQYYSDVYRSYLRVEGLPVCNDCTYNPDDYPLPDWFIRGYGRVY